MCNIVSPIIITKMVSIQTEKQSGKKFNEPTESNERPAVFCLSRFIQSVCSLKWQLVIAFNKCDCLYLLNVEPFDDRIALHTINQSPSHELLLIVDDFIRFIHVLLYSHLCQWRNMLKELVIDCFFFFTLCSTPRNAVPL